ncbi:MAG TPA: GyrI-like domain-containing protein, partial [Polyangiaceae bacterium]|nr:GyrI-like domain-containing protein [Polyangiaceae bacterium]
MSYTLKLMAKKESSRDYIVPPLEGLWWADDMATFISREKDNWSWTMMIMVPDFIDKATATRAALAAAKKKDLPALSKVMFEALEEGTVVQTMHIGSYDDEGPVLRKLHAEVLPANGLKERGKHHEIYLGDLPRLVLAQRGLAFGELVDGSDIDPVLLHGCLCWPVWPGSIHRRRGRRGPRGPRQRSRQDSNAFGPRGRIFLRRRRDPRVMSSSLQGLEVDPFGSRGRIFLRRRRDPRVMSSSLQGLEVDPFGSRGRIVLRRR